MKRLLLAVMMVPVFTFSQSKKKKLKAEQEANAMMVANLKAHIQHLLDDKPAQYIIDQYKLADIQPAGSNGYLQEFTIDEGKQVDEAAFLVANGKKLLLQEDYFPLSFSLNKKVKGEAALAMNEAGEPWFKDVKDWLEDNRKNVHYNIGEAIKNEAGKAALKGATALLVYNSGPLADNIHFNQKDTSVATSSIPVVFITKKGLAHYFKDYAATQQIEMNISISSQKRTVRNIAAFINNHAPATVILGAHYDTWKYTKDKAAADTSHCINDNASGTAALMELARILKQSSPKNNNYLFINFSDEGLGLPGSTYWIQHPSIATTANYMLNMDMVGGYDATHVLTVGGFGTSPAWGEVLASVPHENLQVAFDSSGAGPGDHAVFYHAGLPVLAFFTGSSRDYHTTMDGPVSINYDGESSIIRYIYTIIATADNKNKLTFSKTTEP